MIDWVIRKTVERKQTEIRWQFTNKLGDLVFAGDIALVPSRIGKMQTNYKQEENRAED